MAVNTRDAIGIRLEAPLPPVRNENSHNLRYNYCWGFIIIRTYPDKASDPPSSQSSVTIAESPSPQPEQAPETIAPATEGDPELLQIREIIRAQALLKVDDPNMEPRLRFPIRHMPGSSIDDVRSLLEQEEEPRRHVHSRVVDKLATRYSLEGSAIVVDDEVLQSFREQGEEMHIKIAEPRDSVWEAEIEADPDDNDELDPGWMRAKPKNLSDIYRCLIADPMYRWYPDVNKIY